jgi:hypothetical protein
VLNREEFWKLTNLGAEVLELLKTKFFEFWLGVGDNMIVSLLTMSLLYINCILGGINN